MIRLNGDHTWNTSYHEILYTVKDELYRKRSSTTNGFMV